MTIQIPAKENYVRILSKRTNKVLSDTKNGLDHEDKDVVNPNQWWHIQPHDGGSYAIVNDVTKRCLWCRNKDRRAGCIDSNGKYSDNWFIFEEGKGPYEGYFRIKCPATNCVIVSRTDRKPQVDGFHLDANGSSPIYEDHYFQFLNEDMDNVVMKIDTDKVEAQGQPTMIDHQLVPNDTDIQETQEFNMTQTKDEEHSYEFSQGTEISYGFEFEAKIPEPIEMGAKVTWGVKSIKEFKYGSKKTETNTWSLKIPVVVPPRSAVETTTTIYYSEDVEVPYTMTWTSKWSKTKQEMRGTYKGVRHWGFKTEFKQMKLDDDSMKDGVAKTIFWDKNKAMNRDMDEVQVVDFTGGNQEDTEYHEREEPAYEESGGEIVELEGGEGEYYEVDRNPEQGYQEEPQEPTYDESAQPEQQDQEEPERPSYGEPTNPEAEYQHYQQGGDEQNSQEELEQPSYDEPVDPETEYQDSQQAGAAQDYQNEQVTKELAYHEPAEPEQEYQEEAGELTYHGNTEQEYQENPVEPEK